MGGELLHGAVHRCGEAHQALPLPGLVKLGAELGDLFVRLAQGVPGVAAQGLGVDPAAVCHFVNGGTDLFAEVLLAFQVVPVGDEFAFFVRGRRDTKNSRHKLVKTPDLFRIETGYLANDDSEDSECNFIYL